jgi:hypothetical protein
MHPTTPPPAADDPLCAFCGGEVPVMAAIVYHGVVYHPACVASTTGRTRAPIPPHPRNHSDR